MKDVCLRIAIAGLHHDHVWSHVEDLLGMSGAQIVGAADPFEPLRRRFSERTGQPVFEDPGDLFERADSDAVYFFGDNRWSARWAAEAARRGKHVLVEKPMAADREGAETLYRAARESGVRVMVNWPFVWWAPLQEAIRLASEGRIGRVWQVRYRASHAGPREEGCSDWFCDWLFDPERNGGGALLDYCGYGVILARVLLGMPHTVLAAAGTLVKPELDVEDNALLVLFYSRAMAVAEASWTEAGKATSYRAVIYGTSGTLAADPFAEHPLRWADEQHPQGRPCSVPEPAASMRSASAHFLKCLATGESFDPMCEPESNRDAQAILTAGMESAREGRATAPKGTGVTVRG